MNISKEFKNEELLALINYHTGQAKVHQSLGDTMEKRGLKGRTYVVQRVFASRHQRRVKKLRNIYSITEN
jgi:hypothetical protein